MGKSVIKLTEEMKREMIALYNQGLTDSEIAKCIGNVTDGAIFYWRKQLGLKSKFSYSQRFKIKSSEFEKFFNQGLSDKKIAENMGISQSCVYSFRKSHGYNRDSLSLAESKELTNYQKEVLLGTMLGDSSFIIGKNCINPSISCAHCIAQKEYCELKTKIFENLGAYCKYHKRNIPDKRNGKFYEDYTMQIPANAYLLDWYNAFYPNGKKVIPSVLFQYFTDVSLAFLYMDDGAKVGKHGYTICTHCFSIEDVNMFRNTLKEKFNLDTTIQKDHQIYIRTNCQRLFEHLILPHLCNCMKYKLHKSL